MEYRFECIANCSVCCRLSDGFVFLTEDEAQNIATYFNISIKELYKWFIKQLDDRICLVDGDERCSKSLKREDETGECLFARRLKHSSYL